MSIQLEGGHGMDIWYLTRGHRRRIVDDKFFPLTNQDWSLAR